jgi:Putative cyclase
MSARARPVPLHTRAVPIVDLSHEYADDMPLYPGLPSPSFHDFANVARDGYAMSEYRLLNHIGTHVDAPAHQIAGGDTLDEIPLERLVTEAVTVDLSERQPSAIGGDELEPLPATSVRGTGCFSTRIMGATGGAMRTGRGGRTLMPTRRACSLSGGSSGSASMGPRRIRSIRRRSICTRSGWVQGE